MTTPTLLPCPFCGSSDVSYHAETLYSFVVCGKCEAEGPAISCDETGAMEQAAAAWNQRSAWQPIETAPRDGTWVRLAGGECEFNEESDNKGREVTGRWTTEFNQPCWQFAYYDGGYYGEYENPTHWQPLASPPPITPSPPHAFTEGQNITVKGIQGPYADLNGNYVVSSASSFVQIHDKNGSRLDCEVVTKFSVGDETYLVLDPIHLEVCLVYVKDDGSTQLVEQSDKDHNMILSTFEEVLKDHAPSPETEAGLAIKRFGSHWIAVGLDVILEQHTDGADSDNLETPEEGKVFWNLLVSIRFYHGVSRGHQEYGLYFREPDFYYVAKSSDFVLVEGDEFDRIRQDAEAAIDAVLPPAEETLPITP